jgi:hypothetical protein
MVLIGAAETGLRFSKPGGEVSYASSAQEYRVLPYELARNGAGTIAIVGSSRTREGVSVPDLQKALGTNLQKDQRVAGYALTAARAEDVREVANRLISASPPPGLVLYGVSPRQLTPKRHAYAGRSNMWSLGDWWKTRWSEGREADRQLGRATRYSLGKLSYLLRFEPEIRASLQRKEEALKHLKGTLTRSRGHRNSPMRGNKTSWQAKSPRKVRKITRKRARSYLKNVTEGEPLELSEEMLDSMQVTLETLLKNEVDVVLFEMPVHGVLESVYPEGLMTQFDSMMAELSSRTGVPYLSAEDLELNLKGRDYREQSHMNLRGARKVSKRLAEVVVLPWLEGSGPAAQSTDSSRGE